MSLAWFIAKRISFKSNRSFSRLTLGIGILAISLSVAVMLISVSIVAGFQQEILDKIIGFDAHIHISKSALNQTFENDPIKKDQELERLLDSIPEVVHSSAFATKPGILKTSSDFEGIVLKGVGANYSWAFFQNNLIKGALPDFTTESVSNEILISEKLASLLRMDTGSSATVFFVQQPPRVRKLKVVGIYSTELDEIDKVFVLTDLRHIQRLNDWSEDEIAGYEVMLSAEADLETLDEKIRHLVDYDKDTRTILERYPQIYDWLELLKPNVRIIIALMVVVAVINMITVLLIIIMERTRMVGLLKALGYRDSTIRRVFVINAAMFITLGTLIGNALGIGLLYSQHAFGWAALDKESYYVSQVPVDFSLVAYLAINLGTILICVLAMYLPVLLITRVQPSKSLRFD